VSVPFSESSRAQWRQDGAERADQGLWVKLWCSALGDPDLDNLNIGDFGRVCKLLPFIRQHGTSGHITLMPPSKVLCNMLQLPDFDTFKTFLERIPNVTVTCDDGGDGAVVVTFRNWKKYQVDSSADRTRQWRHRLQHQAESVTQDGDGKRSEEKRSEENGREVKKEKQARQPTLPPDSEFYESLKSNPAYTGINIEVEMGKLDAWLLLPRQVRRGRTKTRATILNWLNGCDRPVATVTTKAKVDSNYFGIRTSVLQDLPRRAES